MRLLNRSSYPTHQVRAIVRRELLRSGAGVVLVMDRPSGSNRQGHVRYRDRRVRIWIGGTTAYPFTSAYGEIGGGERPGFPRYKVSDWREDLAGTAAHEAYHLRHRERGTELEAERAAIRGVGRERRRRPWWAAIWPLG